MFGKKRPDDDREEYLFLGHLEEKAAGERKAAKTESKPEAKPEPKPAQKSERKLEALQSLVQKLKPEQKPEAKPVQKPEAKPEPKPAQKSERKLEALQSLVQKLKPEPKPEAKPKPKPAQKSERKLEALQSLVQKLKPEQKPEAKHVEKPEAKPVEKPKQASQPPKSKPETKESLEEKQKLLMTQMPKQSSDQKQKVEQKRELMQELMEEIRPRPAEDEEKESALERIQKKIEKTKSRVTGIFAPLMKRDEDADREGDAPDEIRMEHEDRPADAQIVKNKGAAPKRRALANPEAMPKPQPKKKASSGTGKDAKQGKKEKAPSTALPFKQLIQKVAPPKPLTKEEKEKMVKSSLDGMFDVYQNPDHAPEKRLAPKEMWRYAVLFLCIFGFLGAGIFVFNKVYSYYRNYVVNTELQKLVSEDDYFQDEYLKKSVSCVTSLTPEEILNGKKPEITGGQTYTEGQQKLVNKLNQLKKINPDTAGWITVSGTVVNYPVVWTDVSNYYLKHNFYGESLSSGTIYIDERNSASVSENLNTVIYGHNMSDGSMFASLHDFSSATVFYSATIQLATPDGIYIYKPFSAHESDAFDNYFETDFADTESFIEFCERMAFLSLHQTETKFDEDTRILTLSTCKNEGGSRDRRFAVHAVLVKVIR